METIRKVDKEYQLSDDSVNCYGFRLQTAGFRREEFLKNPIGFLMHERTLGVMVRWTDLRIDGDRIYAKPMVNLSNPRGLQTLQEIEDGFLNGASMGSIVALAWSDDPELMLPGQYGPTVTDWFARECSVCDIPGNYNSLQPLTLEDAEGNFLNLSDFSTPNKNFPSMKNLTLAPAQLALLNLTAESTPEDFATALTNLSQRAAQVDQLTNDLKAANADKDKHATTINSLKQELTNLKGDDVTKQLEDAVTAGKITVKVKENLAVQYAGKPEALKDLLDAMPKQTLVEDQINKGESSKKFEHLRGKDWSDIMNLDEKTIRDLKANAWDVYAEVYKERFGKEPKKDSK